MKTDNKKNILLVDDQPGNLQTIVDCFVKNNSPYNITKAPNGNIALMLIEKNCPDLIITDWDMPDMDGIEFLNQLKENTATMEIPVIMCTGIMTSSENLQTALNAGAIDYIRKPIDEIELIARTRSVLLLAESRKKIIQQNTDLLELNTKKDKLFSIVGHDLKGPIGAAMSLTELYKNGILTTTDDKAQESFEILHTTLASGYKLLENLLDWSLVELKVDIYKPEAVNIKNIVVENINLSHTIVNTKGIKITNNINTDFYVQADFKMINSILRNLISNAIKFTPKNGTVAISGQEKPDGFEIKVSDTGVGMDSNTIEQLLLSNKIISNRGTNNEIGTGLGLSICKEFLKKHNSKLKITSQPGYGSNFHFILPIAK